MAGYAVSTAQPRRVATSFATGAAITPTDNTAIGPYFGLYVGGAGDIAIVPTGQTSPVTLKAVPVGTYLPIAFQGINNTGTTATNLVGLG